MIDRPRRDLARRVLQRFVEGAITNDEFEAQFPSGTEDSALPAIKANVWMLYSDLHRHKLTRKHAPNAEQRALLHRCGLFLGTNLEFQLPVPTIRLANIFAKLWPEAKASRGTTSENQLTQDHDGEVWPFSNKQEYDKYLAIG